RCSTSRWSSWCSKATSGSRDCRRARSSALIAAARGDAAPHALEPDLDRVPSPLVHPAGRIGEQVARAKLVDDGGKRVAEPVAAFRAQKAAAGFGGERRQEFVGQCLCGCARERRLST